jgi:hypothetical protein
MPVSVPLVKLVALPDSRPLWPAEFESLVAKLEEKPNDRAHWGVIADWCQENDEPELADAFRWVSKQTKVRVIKSQCWMPRRDGGQFTALTLSDKPSSIPSLDDEHCTNPANFAAELAVALAKAREKAKKVIDELA